MASRKPQPGRVNDALLRYLRQGRPVVCARGARTVSKFADGERLEREAIERQRERLARAANRAWQRANPDKVRAAARAWQRANPNAARDYYRAHKDKWRTVYAENRRRAALRAARSTSNETGADKAAAAADGARAAVRPKGVTIA